MIRNSKGGTLLKKLETITCEELMNTPMKPPLFFVGGLITTGLYILAGSPKVGKSWLSLDICLSIAKGEKVLGVDTLKGTALYLCLEDSLVRMQRRLYALTNDPTDDLHLAIMAGTIKSGLVEQIETFIAEHPDTRIIFIDTLQKVREPSQDTAYASDYDDLSVLKSLADRNNIAIVAVHHLRKTKSADPFDMVSGTTAITGCADGEFILHEKGRGTREAVLYCTGRDIENKETELVFDKTTHRWKRTEPVEKEPDESIIFVDKTVGFMKERKHFKGNATELIELLSPLFGDTLYANRITRSLMQYAYLLTEHGVVVESYRTGGKRYIEITYKEDNCDGSDGRKGMPVSAVPSVSENPQTLSQSGNASVTVEDNNTKM